MKLEADLHTHTIASDGYSTVREMAEYAAQKGLKVIAITDHGLGMDGGPHVSHFSNIGMWPRVMSNIEVLRGVEANILDSTGAIDMPEMLLKELDIVLAGFHKEAGYTGTSVEENTRAMIGAIKNSFVHIITHPGNHDYTEIPYLAHSVRGMVGGRIIKSGSVSDVLGDIAIPRHIPPPWEF